MRKDKQVLKSFRDYLNFNEFTDEVIDNVVDTYSNYKEADNRVYEMVQGDGAVKYTVMYDDGVNLVQIFYYDKDNKLVYKFFIEFELGFSATLNDDNNFNGAMEYIEALEFDSDELCIKSTEINIETRKIYGSEILKGDLSTARYEIIAEMDDEYNIKEI